jgi:hypothetical protein
MFPPQDYRRANPQLLTQLRQLLFLDADILILKNIDHIFEMQTPTAIFNDLCQIQYPNTKKDKIGRIEYGTVIDKNDLRNNLFNKGMVINALCVLLLPSKNTKVIFQKYGLIFKTKPKSITMVILNEKNKCQNNIIIAISKAIFISSYLISL